MAAELTYWVNKRDVWVFANLGHLSDAFHFRSLEDALDFHYQREEVGARIYEQLQLLSARLPGGG